MSDESGTIAGFGDGLTGYVLGNSAITWPLPRTSRVAAGRIVRVSVTGDFGPIVADVRVAAGE